ncbi:YebC/PmpR family DNA-binding transcriptional regulator [Thermoproteota archaeon]
MSGHSKWSTIKHKKAKTDAQRGKIFSKMAREITIASKIGGGDPTANTRLRLAIQKAKEVNMPNDNISRAIQKGAGGGEGAALEEIMFEAYAPNGVALIIETLTDNRNRTIPNVKNPLTRVNGNLATKGAVSYMFDQKGLIIFAPDADEEHIMEIATEAGAEDIDKKDDGCIEVTTAPEDFETVRQAFEDNEQRYEDASITMIPQNLVQLTLEQSEKLTKLIDKLEEDDDVQNVYHNADFPDDFSY